RRRSGARGATGCLLAGRRRAARGDRAAFQARGLDAAPGELGREPVPDSLRGYHVSNPLALGLGYAADLILGDPRRGHPVACFGRLARAAERFSYGPSRLRGAGFAASLVVVAALAGEL